MTEEHDVEEVPLAGGVANAGKVVRAGDTVRRPVSEHTPAVHQLLAHLDHVGFRGAPRAFGVDESGREILEWIEGTTYQKGADGRSPLVPADELASVGRLIRDYHDAVASFVPTADVHFAGHEPVGFEGNLIAHRDLCLENVVFRDGEAAALIDFDFAGRADPIWDVAIATRHFVPIADPCDILEDVDSRDLVARVRTLASAYGLDDAELPRLVSAIHFHLERGYRGFKAQVDAGKAAFVELWARGHGERNVRARIWLETTFTSGGPSRTG